MRTDNKNGMEYQVYQTLDASKVFQTAQRLETRVSERFPDSGLRAIVAEVAATAQKARAKAEAVAQPYWALRALSTALIGVILFLIYYAINHIKYEGVKNMGDFVALAEATLGTSVFIGAAIIFVVGLEDRLKRQKALKDLHGLRSLAHIIDMHQLTKDPEMKSVTGPDTASSPERTLTPFELSRYFDYCSESLSLISKIGALYAQSYHDPVAVNAVDQLDLMTIGLSRKIWQKTMIIGKNEG